MKALRLIGAAAILLALAAGSDPEKEANAIFVDAANEIQSATSKDAVDRLNGYKDAAAKIEALSSEKYKSTQAAVKVASGEKVGGFSYADLKTEIARAETRSEPEGDGGGERYG